MNVNRSRSDGLVRLVGRLIRGTVRGSARSRIEIALAATKKKLESGR